MSRLWTYRVEKPQDLKTHKIIFSLGMSHCNSLSKPAAMQIYILFQWQSGTPQKSSLLKEASVLWSEPRPHLDHRGDVPDTVSGAGVEGSNENDLYIWRNTFRRNAKKWCSSNDKRNGREVIFVLSLIYETIIEESEQTFLLRERQWGTYESCRKPDIARTLPRRFPGLLMLFLRNSPFSLVNELLLFLFRSKKVS